MPKEFRITVDVRDITGEDADSIAADILQVCETFLDTTDITINVAQKQGENYFTRDPGDDDL